MRRKEGEQRALSGAECRRAWAMMSRGFSLTMAAAMIGVSPKRLDLAIWRWRAGPVHRPQPVDSHHGAV